MHHGRFHLPIPLAVEEHADLLQDFRTHAENSAAVVIDDQVQVTAAVPQFLVLEPVPFLRKGMKGFGQQCKSGNQHRQFSGPCTEQCAGNPDNISHIENPDHFKILFRHFIFAQVHLEFGFSIKKMGEHALPHAPQGHNPSGQLKLLFHGLQGFTVGFTISLDHLGERVAAIKLIGPQVQAQFLQLLQFLPANFK